jgi:hypothetical protein
MPTRGDSTGACLSELKSAVAATADERGIELVEGVTDSDGHEPFLEVEDQLGRAGARDEVRGEIEDDVRSQLLEGLLVLGENRLAGVSQIPAVAPARSKLSIVVFIVDISEHRIQRELGRLA